MNSFDFRPLTFLAWGRRVRRWCPAARCGSEPSKEGPVSSPPAGPSQSTGCGWGPGPVRRRPRGPVRNRAWRPAASSSDCSPLRELVLPPPSCGGADSRKVACPVCCPVYCLPRIKEKLIRQMFFFRRLMTTNVLSYYLIFLLSYLCWAGCPAGCESPGTHRCRCVISLLLRHCSALQPEPSQEPASVDRTSSWNHTFTQYWVQHPNCNNDISHILLSKCPY